MHELAIAESVVDAVTQRLPGAKITSVHLEIGALSGVVAESIRFCFDLATEGTGLEGATLEITEPPGLVTLKTVFGGTRIVDLLVGDPLPRIC